MQGMVIFQYIPIGTSGNLYRSVMPFGAYDPEGTVIGEYLDKSISTVVMLVSDNECMEKADKHLSRYYDEKGFNVLMLPSEDYGIPDRTKTKHIAKEVLQRLHKGEHVAVHCSAGIGRTGTFLACLAKEHWALAGEDAVKWIRAWIPLAIETEDQHSFVRRY